MEFLKDLFTEGMTYEQFSKAVTDKGIKLADLSTGEYVAKGKLTESIAKAKDLEAQLGTITSELNTLKEANASADDWKAKFDTLQQDVTAKNEQAKREQEDRELSEAIAKSFGEKEFINDYVKNGIIADMKAQINLPENRHKGFVEIFDSLTKDKQNLFVPKHGNGAGNVGGQQGSGSQQIDLENPTYEQLIEYLAANPDTKLE